MWERLKEDREDAGEWEWQSVDEEGMEAWEEKEREKMREREKMQETREYGGGVGGGEGEGEAGDKEYGGGVGEEKVSASGHDF
jgi:hypothetical protein